MEKLYAALIGDMIKSRKVNHRKELQTKLEDVLTKINFDYEKFIESKFLITVGDEFQGLLKPSAPIYQMICSIVESLYPVQVRFGLGLGGITTPVKEIALGMDGPAFYAAREALDIAYGKKEHAIVFKSEFNIMGKDTEEVINVILGSLAVIRKLWPESFWEILPHLREQKTQTEVASITGTTQPYISKLIKNACWKEVELLETQAGRLLSSYFVTQNAL